MTNLFDTLEFMGDDPEGELIYQAALAAVAHARKDGQSSGKHSPGSWREETIENQIVHAWNHVNDIDLFIKDMNGANSFLINDAEHALCRLAIAIALLKRNDAKEFEKQLGGL